MTDLERRLAGSPAATLDREALGSSLARRASEAGLLDVAFAALDSPMGQLTVFVTPRGLVRLAYPDAPVDALLDEMAERLSPRILHAPARTDAARRELEAYFAGQRQAFDVPVDWSLIHGFATGVLHATAQIPFGRTSSYGEVAISAGSPRAARAAGNALGSNPIPIVVPCHRVLHADGGLGGYSGGLDRKRFLLRLEGSLQA